MRTFIFFITTITITACSTTNVERFGRYQIVRDSKSGAEGLRDSISGKWIFPKMSGSRIFNLEPDKFAQFNPTTNKLTGVYLESDTAIYTTASGEVSITTKPLNLLPMLPDTVQDLWLGDLVIFRNNLGTARAGYVISQEIVTKHKGIIYHQGFFIHFENPDPGTIDFNNIMHGNIVVTDKAGKILAKYKNAGLLLPKDGLQIFIASKSKVYNDDESSSDVWQINSLVNYDILQTGQLIKKDSIAFKENWFLENQPYMFQEGDKWTTFKTKTLKNAIWVYENEFGMFFVENGEPKFADRFGNVSEIPANKRLFLSTENDDINYTNFSHFTYSKEVTAERHNNHLIFHGHYGYNEPQYQVYNLEYLLKSPEALSISKNLTPSIWESLQYTIQDTPTMYHVPATGKSGVFDLTTYSWVIPDNFIDIHRLGNYYLARKDTVTPQTEAQLLNQILDQLDMSEPIYLNQNSKVYYLFSEKGTLIKTYVDSIPVADLAIHLNSNINENQITTISNKVYEIGIDGKSLIINQELPGYVYTILQPEEGVIPKSFNTGSGNYFTQFGSAIGLGLSNFKGLFRDVRLDAHHNEIQLMFYNEQYTEELSVTESKGFDNQFGKSCKNNRCILVNSIKGNLMLLEYYDENGDIVIDKDGNIKFMTDYTPGVFNTGVWDIKNKTWLVPPKYAGGILWNGGFTMLEVKEIVTNESLDFIKSYHVFDDAGNLIKSLGESFDLTQAETLTYFGVDADSVVKAYDQVDANERVSKVLYLNKGKYGYTEEIGLGNLTTGRTSDWICPTENHLIHIESDAVKIGNLSFPLHKMNIIINREQLQITQSDLSITYLYSDDSKLWHEEPIDFSSEYNYSEFYISKDTILVNKSENKYNAYDDETGETMITFSSKSADDELWVLKNGKWQLVINEGSIKPISFGFLLSAPYRIVTHDDWMSGEYTVSGQKSTWVALNKELQPLSQFSEYKIIDFHEYSSFIVMIVVKNNQDMYALVGKSGKIYTTKYDYFNPSPNDSNVIECGFMDEHGNVSIEEEIRLED